MSEEEDERDFRPSEVFATVEESEIFGPNGPCPVLVETGTLPDVVVISGENAGGKSLLCRGIQSHVASHSERAGKPIEMMRVGMDMRTTSGIQRALMFGSESEDSTGKISVSSVLAGLKTAKMRENPHWLILDEPDVGVGEGYRRAMGELFAAFASDLPKNTVGFVVVTHSRDIAGPMIAAGASSVRVGDDLRPVAEWIRDGDLPKTIADLESLPRRAVERLREVTRTMRGETGTSTPSGPR